MFALNIDCIITEDIQSEALWDMQSADDAVVCGDGIAGRDEAKDL